MERQMSKIANLVSSCCNAPIKVSGGDSWDDNGNGTRYYVCMECGGACNAVEQCPEN